MSYSIFFATLTLISLALPSFGAVVLWQRRSFLADTVAHSAIFGSALSLFLPLPNLATIFLVALMVTFLSNVRPKSTPHDAWLIFIASGLMAAGGLLIDMFDSEALNIKTLFFGDIFMMKWQDVLLLGGSCALALGHLYAMWPYIMLLILNEEMAAVSSYPTRLMKLILNVAVALVVAVSIQYLGVLLLSAFMILPNVIARQLSESPLQMMLKSCVTAFVCGTVAGVISLPAALNFSSVCILLFCFVFAVVTFIRKTRRQAI